MNAHVDPLAVPCPFAAPHHASPLRAAVPAAAPAVPPRRAVPAFPPIRRGSGGRHRLQQAVRHRPGVLAAGLLAAATALAAGPMRPGSPPPATATAAAQPAGVPRCTGATPATR